MSHREPAPREMHMPLLLAGMTDEIVPDIKVRGLTLDSRQVCEGSMFLACRGGQQHGLDYWPQAEARGASALVWEPHEGVVAPETSVPSVAVNQLSDLVAEIAARYYGYPSREMFVAGITGTDGKTSCAWLLSQACRHMGQQCGYLGTLGYGLPDLLEQASHTTPDPVSLQYWLARLRVNGATAVAMEVSSHALDQGRANGVAFDVALLTNLGRDHLDYHGDMESYAASKRRLFQVADLPAAVLNADDEVGRAWLKELADSVEVVAFGFSENISALGVAYVRGLNVICDGSGVGLDIESSWGDARLSSALLGRFNAANLLACLAVLLVRGESIEECVEALAASAAVPGRMEALESLEDQPLVVVDYAHTPQALRQALLAARAHAAGKVVCVFGCGGDRDQGKRPLMGEIAAELADKVIVTDDNPRGEVPAAIVNQIIHGMPEVKDLVVEHNRAEAIRLAIDSANKNDVILIAGKGHEDYQWVGNERLPFDDRQVAASILAGRNESGGLH